jgi:hypothetical protein
MVQRKPQNMDLHLNRWMEKNIFVAVPVLASQETILVGIKIVPARMK